MKKQLELMIANLERKNEQLKKMIDTMDLSEDEIDILLTEIWKT